MIKIGILGTGFGFQHAKIFKNFSDVEIKGIFGRDETKLNQIKEKLNVPITTNPTVLLNDPEIDLIDVVLPTEIHREFCIKALKAGKHVFCETPISYTLEDAEAIQKCAKTYNRHVFVGLFMLFSPEFEYVLNHSASHTLGQLRNVFISRRTPRIWGDMNPIILNLMLHDFDYIYALIGCPLSIQSRNISAANHQGEHILVSLNYPNTLVSIEGSSMLPESYPFSLTLQVMGEQETIELHYPSHTDDDHCEVIHYPVNHEAFNPKIKYHNEYVRECRHVIDCLQNKNLSVKNSLEIAISSLKMALAAKDSYDNNGTTIKISEF